MNYNEEFFTRLQELINQYKNIDISENTLLIGASHFTFWKEKAEEDLQKVKIEDEVSDEVCELCGRNMVVKYGPHGKFLACPGFPECRNTKPYLEKIGVKCPKCGKEIVLRRSSKGRKFYSCEGYPDCDFVSWKRPEAPKEQMETPGEAVKD